MSKSIIYGLRCPINGEYKYIGKSKNGLQRAKSHLVMSHNQSVRIWVEELREKGMCPLIDIIEECEDVDLDNRERFWINYFNEVGAKLMNLIVYRGEKIHNIENEIREKEEYLTRRLSSINEAIDNISTFNGVIKYIRRERGLTQQQLSELSGVSLRAVKTAESENGNPTLQTIERIGDVLGMRVTLMLKDV